MNKKICVYAIAKNEIKFVERWFNSVKEADYVCVLDTGSTDGTYEKLKSLGVITKQKKYDFFRFDTARNDSMKLIPQDAEICVCVDIDEFFNEGWSQILKDNWTNNTLRVRYRYTWNFNPDGTEGIVFMSEKIHKNGYFKWEHPVHEILVPIKNTNLKTIDLYNLQLNHKADTSKSRSNYLPLLELSVKESPTDDRNVHYLGREYMFHGEYKKAIETLKYHLSLKTATWKDERCASLRYIARCYGYLNNQIEQEKYLMLALLEADHIREPYYELGVLYYNKKDYLKSATFFNEMFKIKERYLNYISDPVCWSGLPYDYLSLCYYELKDYDKAIQNVNYALLFSNNERLLNNREYFIKIKNEKKKETAMPSFLQQKNSTNL